MIFLMPFKVKRNSLGYAYTIPVCVLKVTVIQHLRTIFIRKSCDLNVVNSANLALKVNGSDKYFYPPKCFCCGI